MGKFGRPTTYGDEVLEKSLEYLECFSVEHCERPEEVKDEVIPSIIGLCRYIKRGKTTVYNWIADKEDKNKDEFRDITSMIEEGQYIGLTSGGLSGKFNPMITKLMLSKHGLSDKVEVDNTSSDGSMSHPGYTIVDE